MCCLINHLHSAIKWMIFLLNDAEGTNLSKLMHIVPEVATNQVSTRDRDRLVPNGWHGMINDCLSCPQLLIEY